MVYSLVKVTSAYKKDVSDCYYMLHYEKLSLYQPCERCEHCHVEQSDCAEIFYEQLGERVWRTDVSAMSSESTCERTESANGEPELDNDEVPVEKESPEVVTDDTSEQSRSPEDTGDDLAVPDTEKNTSEQSRSDIDEIPDAEEKTEKQNGNEENGQVMDDDQDEEVEVVNEGAPTTLNDELELMIEELKKFKPAIAWPRVDINDPVVREIERTITMDPKAAKYTKDFELRSVKKQRVKGCVYKLSLDLTGPDGLVKCNVLVTDQLYFEFRQVKFLEWNPVEPWSRSQVDAKDVEHLLLGDFYDVDVDDVTVQDMAYNAVAHLNDKKSTD